MSIIGSVTSGGANSYYQLDSLTDSENANVTENAENAENSTATTPSLLDILNGDTDTVNLSAEAQAYLATLSESSATTTNFTLSRPEEAALKGIVDKYADMPKTQENFEALQEDLAANGLSPEQLAMKHTVKSFNSTSTFLSVLKGKSSAGYETPAQFNLEDHKSQMEAYMQNVARMWQGDE